MWRLVCLVVLSGVLVVSVPPIVYAQAEDNSSQKQPQNAAEPIPYRQDSVLSPATLLKVLLAAVFAIGFAIVIIFVLKKYLYNTMLENEKGRRIHLIEAKRLSPKLSLFLVEIDKQPVLLSLCGDSVDILSLGKERQSVRPEHEHE